MKGYIYIASAFETVNRSTCGQKGSWADNDPHFWTSPPTWGRLAPDISPSTPDIFVSYRKVRNFSISIRPGRNGWLWSPEGSSISS